MRCVAAVAASMLIAWPCAFAAPPVATLAPPAVPRPLEADDFYRAAALSDPQVSPEGAWVAYVVTTNDREADEARSAVWMVSWDGASSLPLTTPAADTGKPRWSPDGRYLAFIGTPAGSAPEGAAGGTAATAPKPQLMLLDRRGGAPRPLTTVAGDIVDYAWAPDGRHIALSLDGAPGGTSDKTPKPWVIDAMHFKSDEDGYLTAGRLRRLYLLDVETQQLEALTPGSGFDELLPTWSPDGSQLAFTRTPGWGWDPAGQSEVCVMQARPGATIQSVLRFEAPNSQHLEWTADGRGILYLKGLAPKLNAYIQDHLARVEIADGSNRELARDADRAVTSFAPSGQDALIATMEDDGSVHPVRLDLRGGAPTRLGPSGGYVMTSVTSHGGHTAALQTNDTQLAEVVALEDGRLRRLTHHNDAWLGEVGFGAVEDLAFKSRDGTDVHALLVKPVGFVGGRRYPTVLWIHGGPNGQDQHELVLDGYEFEHQWLAGRGYAVLRVNYRGGSGRGAAFAQAIAADWGHREVEDLLAGVDALVARGIADPTRLGVGGWSYGGILTDYTIASDARFKAAVSGAGSANQLSMYGADQYLLQYEHELGSPWRDTAKWLKLSYPFLHADRIHTPTLFLGGEKDFNVPVAGGEQMYQALKVLGVPAQLVVYPDQHHVLSRPSFVVDLAERVTAWYGQYLQAAAAPAAMVPTPAAR